MRRLGILAAAIVGLTCGTLTPPEAALRDFAGAGAIHCGAVDGWAGDQGDSPAAAHECAVKALAQGKAFYVTAAPASADGGTIFGWAFDGQHYRKVIYGYATGCTPVYSDDTRWEDCERIEAARAPQCTPGYADLCLRCVVGRR